MPPVWSPIRKGICISIRCAEDTPHGGVLLKVSADGSRLSVVATGFRNPNGLGVSPSGVITAADQQGTVGAGDAIGCD